MDRKADGEDAPAARLAFCGQLSTQQFRQPSRDGQSQPCPISPAGRGHVCLCEWLEQRLEPIWFNAYAGVPDSHLEQLSGRRLHRGVGVCLLRGVPQPSGGHNITSHFSVKRHALLSK